MKEKISLAKSKVLSDEFNPKNGHNTNCSYDCLLLFVYRVEHLLPSIYKNGHEYGYYERSIATHIYKHRVL